MKKILITGGTVFVSKYLAEYFAHAGNEVFVFNRDTHPQVNGVHLIKGDKHEVCGEFRNHRFDLVLAVNIYTADEMRNLLDGLGEIGDFVFISSSAVYPETTPLPFKETDPTGVNTIWGDYGTNKIAAEQQLLDRLPNAYVLRPPYFYGKYQNLYREGFVFDCAMKKMPFYIPKDGKMPLQFYHVHDLCKIIGALIAKKPREHILNVGNKEIVDINTFVEICYDIVGTKLQKVYVDASHGQRSYFPFHDYAYSLNVTKQYEIISDTVPLYDGLKEYFDYYKDHQNEVMKKTSYFEYIEKYLKQ